MRAAGILLIGAAWLAAGPVLAAPSSLVAWTVETMERIESGDPERGKDLAGQCASCHGSDGVAPSPNWPSLAGQLATYTYKQLKDYQDGKRENAIMKSMVQGLSDQDMADLAAFYAAQDLPPPRSEDDGGEVAETLVFRGDGERLIAGCRGCHGRRGEGNVIAYPALAGQHPQYFRKTMQAYASGQRDNDVYARMRSIAAELTEEEIEALGAYYGSLGSAP
jgi:cytochrome c553